MVSEPTPRRFTVEEYYAMGAAGILRPDERTELIDGEIITMPPIGPEHADDLAGLVEQFVRLFHGRARMRGQSPIHLPDGSEPEPDLALVRLRLGGYRDRHPTPDDVLLVIEVSDTTASYDRGRKLLLYARSGIREVWIVNMPAQRVEVCREPDGGGYRLVEWVTRDGFLTLLAFPDIRLAAADILLPAATVPP